MVFSRFAFVSFLTTLNERPISESLIRCRVQTDTTATNHFHYACRDHDSGFAAAEVFGANTPVFGAIDAAEVVTGFWGASAC